MSASDSYTCNARWITYVFLLNLGLQGNRQRISERFKAMCRVAYLFFRGEVIDDVEELPDFFRGLPLDHVGDGLAPNITT